MMNWAATVVFIGSRGIGKTFLSAVFCVIRCILYPGTKIAIASGKRDQAIQVLEKIILELKPNSPELAGEIDEKETHTGGAHPQIVFRNGSYIKVVTAGESARSNRANLLLLDEFRLIKEDVVNTILRKFLTQRRMPKYKALSKEERKIAWSKERNKTMYLSSAYFADHWSYTKCVDTYKAMVSDKKRQFVCGLPYQLPASEGLIDPDVIMDEMAESNFNETKFKMEYEALWYGSGDDSFFDFTSLSKNRKIKYPMLPDRLANKLNNAKQVSITPKEPGEIRILSADIALMASRKHKNDATAIFINRMLPTKAGRYMSNFVYTDSCEGLHTEDQALMIRKLFDEYECDYLVIDAYGVGHGVYDCLVRDMVDSEAGEIYEALSCCNNDDMAARCTTPGARKVIWAMKASPQINSDAAYLTREGFRSGRIRILSTEYDAEVALNEIKGYKGLSQSAQIELQLPYINTTLLVDEMTKLQSEPFGGDRVKLKEKPGARKDRYSSLSYNYYVAIQIENKMRRKLAVTQDGFDSFVFRPPSSHKTHKSGKAVNFTSGRKNKPGWA